MRHIVIFYEVVCDLSVRDVIMWLLLEFFFFFKQKTAYEMLISDWSSDVCSSDLYVFDHLKPYLPASSLRVSFGHSKISEERLRLSYYQRNCCNLISNRIHLARYSAAKRKESTSNIV